MKPIQIRQLLRASVSAYPRGRFHTDPKDERHPALVAALMRSVPAIEQRRLSDNTVAALYDLYRWNLDLASDGCSKVAELPRLRDRSGRDVACLLHDILYKLCADRAVADAVLRQVCAEGGYPLRGWIRWMGVRVFGRQPYRECVKVREYDRRVAAHPDA